MFVLDGKPLPLDRPFQAHGTMYPANWLRLASPAEREAIGITWKPDPVSNYDQRFYWGRDQDGNLIPKDHGGLVTLWTETAKRTANTLLSPTDWTVIREIDNNTPMPSGVKTYRQEVRYACEAKVTTLLLTSGTPQLADYITYVSPSGGAPTDWNYWPSFEEPASDVAASGVA